MKQIIKYTGLFMSLSILISFLSCNIVSRNNSLEDLPNIIFILADDLGYGDLACYGHPYAKTPNIDKLAKEGASFKRFYAAGITCSPSRTAFMTAKHPATFSKYTADFGFGDNITITELLKNAGYTTAHIGKWHIGPESEIDKHPYGLDLIKIMEGTPASPNGKDSDKFDFAIDFIKNNNNLPFYINIWTNISHYPITALENMQQHFEDLNVDEKQFGRWFNQDKLQVLKEKGRDIDEAMKMYLTDVYSLDFNIGRLMQCIKEQNLEQNTIVIFSSDQGPAPAFLKNTESTEEEEKMLNMLGYAGGLRGGKHNQYEGGIRVPFIVKWPQKIPENHIDDKSVISALDYLPTICSIVGIEYRSDSLDGGDKSNVWFGVSEKREGPLFWKKQTYKATISILDYPWKMHKWRNGEVNLYNIETDPFEEYEISADHNDIVLDLSGKIDNWNKKLPAKEKDQSDKHLFSGQGIPGAKQTFR